MSWLASILGRKESAFSQAIVSQYPTGQAIWTPDNFEHLAREGYRLSPYVYTCVNKVAQGCAGIPLTLFQEGKASRGPATKRALAHLHPEQRPAAIKRMLKSGELREATDDAMLRVLGRPNPLYDGRALIEASVAYRLLSGNTYVETTGPTNRPPLELYTHRPDRCQVLTGDAADPVRGYRYRAGGVVRDVEAAAILHWKTFNPLDDWYGLSPLVAAARSVDANNSARAWNVSLTQNSARPSGLLVVKGGKSGGGNLTAFMETIKGWIGKNNAGKPGIIGAPADGDVNWVQTAFTPLEISWIEGIKLTARDIAMVYGVPYVLIDPDASTFANQAEGRRALYQETILPLMDNLVGAFNNTLTPRWGDNLILGYDLDQIEALQEDADRIHRRTQRDWLAGIITLNEARRAIGEDEITTPEGDMYSWQVKAQGALGSGGVGENTGDPAATKTNPHILQLRAAS